MKKLSTCLILLILCSSIYSQELKNSTFFQKTPESRTEAVKHSRITNKTGIRSANPSDLQEILTSWCENKHVPGMSVNILRNGDVFWDLHYGYSNIEQNKPVSDSTCFILCSASKLFVQTAIMQLYEQNSFDLDDNINGNLLQPIVNPHFPFNAITYFQLMTHTSSLVYGFPHLYQYVVWGVDPTIPLGDFIEGLLIPGGAYYYEDIWDTSNSPGTVFDYSNIGNCVLGHLIESISEQDLDDYFQENLFNPLGIGNASYFLSNIDTSQLAVPYEYAGGQYNPYPQPGAPFYPSAFLKISAADLAKFLGMYMKKGTFNGNTILNPETVELVTTVNDGSLYQAYNWGQMCLSWIFNEDIDMTYGGGTWDPIANSGIAYDKEEQWGIVFLLNTRVPDEQFFYLFEMLANFSRNYDPLSVEFISVNDTDEDQMIEAGEEFALSLTLRNNSNLTESAEDVVVTLSHNSTFIDFLSDSVVSLGTINYLDEVQLPADQFVFSVNEDLEPGNIEFQLHINWNNGMEYTNIFYLFAGHTNVLLVRDETNRYVDNLLVNTQDWYLQPLDSLGYETHYYDLEVRGDPTPGFINNFPAVIWFTGNDAENTLSVNNQTLLSNYLDSGGRLLLSGQNISDELQGTDFLNNYLFTTHVEDTWSGQNKIEGIENDIIGDGQVCWLNTGEGLANQYSMSVVDPLADAFKVFGYYPSLEGAAVRYENDIFKTVFFAFGFEAINGFDNRYEILSRVLGDYLEIPHPCLPGGITFSSQDEIDSFKSNYPNCIKIGGDVQISGPDITNLDSLTVITEIGGHLSILNNNSLDSLSGLQNVTSIGGDLIIEGNFMLTDLAGLDNINPGSIDNLQITYNASLSTCNVTSICEYLAAPGGSVTISGNANGCNNQAEVQEACINSSPEIESEALFTIFPNPVESNALIEYNLPDKSSVLLKVLDLNGRILKVLLNEDQQKGKHKVLLNTADLRAGVYFITLNTLKEKHMVKVVKH